jgi:uncharacterized membrane protein YccC
MLQIYIQQYGQQNFVSMIVSSLKNVDNNLASVISSDAKDELRIEAIDKALSTLQILASLDQANQEQYLNKMIQYAETLYQLQPTAENKQLLDNLKGETENATETENN